MKQDLSYEDKKKIAKQANKEINEAIHKVWKYHRLLYSLYAGEGITVNDEFFSDENLMD